MAGTKLRSDFNQLRSIICNNRSRLIQLFFYFLSEILTALFTFFTIGKISNSLNQTLYGAWAQILVYASVALPLLTLCLESGIIRFLPAATLNKRAAIIRLSFRIIFLMMLVYTAISSISAEYTAKILFSDARLSIIVLPMMLYFGTQSLYLVSVSILRAIERTNTISALNISHVALRICGLSLLITSEEKSLIDFILYVSCINTALVIFVYLKHTRKILAGSDSSLEREDLSLLLAFCGPILINSLLNWLSSSVDRVFLLHYLGLVDIAHYSVMNSIGKILTFFYGPLLFIGYSIISKYWDMGEKAKALSSLSLISKLYISASIPLAILLAGWGGKILELFNVTNFLTNTSEMILITVGVFYFGLQQILVVVLHLHNRTYLTTSILLKTALLGVGLNAILIPFYGIKGACLSYLLTTFTLVIATIMAISRVEKSFSTFKYLCLTSVMGVLTILMSYSRTILEGLLSYY